MAIKNQELSKYLTPLIHILFWMLLFFLPHLVKISSTGVQFSDSIQSRFIFQNLVLVIFFYVNAYFLYPVLYKKKGVLTYIAVLALSVFLLIKSSSAIEKTYFPFKRNSERKELSKTEKQGKGNSDKGRRKRGGDMHFYFLMFPYIFIIGISISYRITRDAAREEKVRKERENENLKTELAFLRSQVSPHFMFNVLNTFVSMARKKSDLMEPSLIKLSQIMRYMLYENNDERIPLEKEVEYLKNYIDLQLLRFGDDLDLQMNIAKNFDGYEIEPMLLISFVENAFKHGIGMVEDPFIKINLSLDAATNALNFVVENSVAPNSSAKDNASGIGLSNMRRRLELLYKDRYKLETVRTGSTFVSSLNIHLK